MAAKALVKVLVWDENPLHASKEIYPKSIRGAIAEGLAKYGKGKLKVKTAHLDEPDQGVSEEALADADVLVWWGHARHNDVKLRSVQRVARRVKNEGMGFIAVHSAHYSKTFQAILDATGHLKGGWRVDDPPEKEQVRVCAPWHPIAQGIEDFVIDAEEMYGAPFDVPPPLEVVFQSYFPLDAKTFPCGLCWTVGKGIDKNFASGPGKGIGQGMGTGRVFYFRPGHEAFPTLHLEPVQKILTNAALWCAKRS